jgi:hypothetical protein
MRTTNINIIEETLLSTISKFINITKLLRSNKLTYWNLECCLINQLNNTFIFLRKKISVLVCK